MKFYNVNATVRHRGSIGIFWNIEFIVYASDKEDAKLKAMSIAYRKNLEWGHLISAVPHEGSLWPAPTEE